MEQEDGFDRDLIHALHVTFANHLEKLGDMPASTVILSLIGFTLSELVQAMHSNPNGFEYGKKVILDVFTELLDNTTEGTMH